MQKEERMPVKRKKLKRKRKNKGFWGKNKLERVRLKKEYEVVPILELKLWNANPRMNDDAVEPLSKLIKEHGFAGTIVATPDGVIRSGNTRFKALLLLMKDPDYNLEEKVWVHWKNFPSEAAANSYALADNKASEWTTWDHAKLAKMFKTRIKADLQQLRKHSGFRTQEINWQGAEAIDLDTIGEFEETDTTYVIRIDNVLQGDREEVLELVKEAIEEYDYEAKIF